MQKTKVIIIGAGGHGKVVADAILKENKYELIGFADDNKQIGEIIYRNISVVCTSELSKLLSNAEGVVLAIGNNKIRSEKFALLDSKISIISVIHPFSSIALDVKMGSGIIVLAGAVINSGSIIGNNCIVNSNALIDHDCKIESHSHIGQAAIVGSGNSLKEFTWVKQGENVDSTFH